MSQPNAQDAALALQAIALRQQQVIDEVDMPAWYWGGLGAAWVGLGVVIDLDHPWLTTAATVLFGAAHASGFSRANAGRRRTGRLSVRADVVGRHVTALVLAFIVVLGAATVALSLLASADGARHPATFAGVAVGIAVACGGPTLMAALRRRRASQLQVAA